MPFQYCSREIALWASLQILNGGGIVPYMSILSYPQVLSSVIREDSKEIHKI